MHEEANHLRMRALRKRTAGFAELKTFKLCFADFEPLTTQLVQ
jgi:hypothetical protein